MLCPRCKTNHMIQHTSWSEMMKPVAERRHEYSCQKCSIRMTQEELNDEMSDVQEPSTNGRERKSEDERELQRAEAG